MQSPDKRRTFLLRHCTQRRGLRLGHAIDPRSGELFTLFGQRHMLAPQIRAARPREITLGLQFFQRGVDLCFGSIKNSQISACVNCRSSARSVYRIQNAHSEMPHCFAAHR